MASRPAGPRRVDLPMPPETPAEVDPPHGLEPCPLPARLESLALAPRTMCPGCNLLLVEIAVLATGPGVDPCLLLARFLELARRLRCFSLGPPGPTHPEPRLLLAGPEAVAAEAATFVSTAIQKEAGVLVPLLVVSGRE